MESSWTDPNFVNAPDAPGAGSGGGKFMKQMDVPTDSCLILKYVDRLQKDMTPELRSKMEVNGNKVGDVYWVYYFDDSTKDVVAPREYSAFKKMTALTIAMKGAEIEKGDVFTARRIGGGTEIRFEIVKLASLQAVEEAQLKAKQPGSVADGSGIPF